MQFVNWQDTVMGLGTVVVLVNYRGKRRERGEKSEKSGEKREEGEYVLY
jgi:hypothetical protein